MSNKEIVKKLAQEQAQKVRNASTEQEKRQANIELTLREALDVETAWQQAVILSHAQQGSDTCYTDLVESCRALVKRADEALAKG
jgi:hypothetical protein